MYHAHVFMKGMKKLLQTLNVALSWRKELLYQGKERKGAGEYLPRYSAVEQWSARWAHNPKVAGSNPARATKRSLNTIYMIAEKLLKLIRETHRLSLLESLRQDMLAFARSHIHDKDPEKRQQAVDLLIEFLHKEEELKKAN